MRLIAGRTGVAGYVVDDAQWRSLCRACGLVVDERGIATTPLDVERYILGLQHAFLQSLDNAKPFSPTEVAKLRLLPPKDPSK